MGRAIEKWNSLRTLRDCFVTEFLAMTMQD